MIRPCPSPMVVSPNQQNAGGGGGVCPSKRPATLGPGRTGAPAGGQKARRSTSSSAGTGTRSAITRSQSLPVNCAAGSAGTSVTSTPGRRRAARRKGSPARPAKPGRSGAGSQPNKPGCRRENDPSLLRCCQHRLITAGRQRLRQGQPVVTGPRRCRPRLLRQQPVVLSPAG